MRRGLQFIGGLMQTYTKLNHRKFILWTKKNRKLSKEAKIVYLYLLTSPLTHHSGLFEFSEELLLQSGLNEKEIKKGIKELLANGLITVDEQLEYCLIPYLVENIILDNKNMAKSLINYLLNLEKTFLLGRFLEIIENTNVFNRFKTVDEPLLNRFLTVCEPFRNINNKLNIINNKEYIINDKQKIKNDKLEIKDNKEKKKKEKKALLKKDAEEVYKFYKDNIKGGARGTTIDRIYNIFLENKEITKDMLFTAINNYIVEKKETGTTEFKFYKAPENFFSKANEVYKDYLGYDVRNRKLFLNDIDNIDLRNYNTDTLKIKIQDLINKYGNDINNKTIETAYNILSNKQDNMPF